MARAKKTKTAPTDQDMHGVEGVANHDASDPDRQARIARAHAPKEQGMATSEGPNQTDGGLHTDPHFPAATQAFQRAQDFALGPNGRTYERQDIPKQRRGASDPVPETPGQVVAKDPRVTTRTAINPDAPKGPAAATSRTASQEKPATKTEQLKAKQRAKKAPTAPTPSDSTEASATS